MSGAPSIKQSLTKKTVIWLAVAAGLLLIIGANTHLVYVAVTSQPECVAHLRPGEGGVQRGSFSAAQSACSPQRQSRDGEASE
jgi:hypothetical protein